MRCFVHGTVVEKEILMEQIPGLYAVGEILLDEELYYTAAARKTHYFHALGIVVKYKKEEIVWTYMLNG